MEYVPYRITAGSHKIKLYQNESHGLRTFTSLEDGKEFLKSEAIGVVKYEESGKNAENCVYKAKIVEEDIHSVKTGLFVEELEDGFALKEKRYDGFISWAPTITEKEFYMLSSLVRTANAPPKRVERKTDESSGPSMGILIADLNAELKSFLEAGFQLKPTGLLEGLVEEEEEPQEVIIESYEDTDYSSEECILDLPLIQELPPLPQMRVPVDMQSFEPMLNKVSFERELDEAIAEIDETINEEKEQRDFIDRALDEIEMLRITAQTPFPHLRIPSEEPEASESSYESSSSEDGDFWRDTSESSSDEEFRGYSYSA